MKILIVDDEEMIRDVLREYAEFEGYEVFEAEDGMEAVRLCRDNDYDLILMDIMMPHLDGFSAVKEIKKSKDIPVGPGRGSAAGSMVSYCLYITDIDPVQYSLYFERFLNPERVSMPDIDMDFGDTRRGEVVDFLDFYIHCQ